MSHDSAIMCHVVFECHSANACHGASVYHECHGVIVMVSVNIIRFECQILLYFECASTPGLCTAPPAACQCVSTVALSVH